MPYVGKSPSAVGVRNRFYFTASGGETSFSGSDDNGKTLVFTDAAYVDVILNGGNLVSGTDYTATPSTNTIGGLVALVSGDVVEIIAYDVFSVSDTVSASSGGTFNGGLTISGNINVTGTVDGRDVATDGTKLDGIEASADVTDTTNVTAAGALMTTGGSLTGAVDIAITSNQGLLIDATAGNNAYLTITNSGSNTGAKIGFDNASNATVIGHHTFGNILYANSSGKVGIGTTSPSYKTEISDGTVTFGVNPLSAYSTAYVGTTTNHGMNFITNGNSRLNITSGGNVGIGTASPSRLLSLNSSNASIDFSNGTWTNEIINSAGQMEFRADHTNSAASSVMTFSVDGTEAARIDSSGNVGIGTTSPSRKLEVNNGGTGSLVTFTDGVATNFTFRTDGSNVGTFGTEAGSTQLAFMVANSEKVRIAGNGNVGIGTSSPAYTLQVGEGNGQMSLGNATSGNGASRLKFLSSTTQKNWQISTNDNVGGALEFTQTTAGGGTTFAASPAFRINSNGSLTATASLTYPSGYGPAWGATYITGHSSSHFINFFTNATERMKIDSSGRVTMPYQPSFAATRSQGAVSNAVYVYPNVYYNTGNHYNSSNGRFTAPVSGSYFIATNHMSNNNATHTNVAYYIRVNGTNHQLVYSSSGSAVHHRWSWSGVIYLNQGDYIDVYVASGLTLYGNSNLYTQFSGHLLG